MKSRTSCWRAVAPLVEVARNDSVTGKERDEEELKKLANDFLTLVLVLNVQELKKIRSARIASRSSRVPPGHIMTDRSSSSSKQKTHGHLLCLPVSRFI